MLVFQGPGKFYIPHGSKHKELERISYTPRDCYAVWSHEDGVPLCDPDIEVRIGRSQSRRVHAMQSGRGVIYARNYHVSADPFMHIGEIMQVRVALVRFRLDLDPRGDAVRYTLQQETQNLHSGETDKPLRFMKNEPIWHELVTRARDGFNADCVEVTPELKLRYDDVLNAARETKRRMDAERTERSFGSRYPRW